MVGEELEDEVIDTIFHLGHSVIARAEGTIREIVDGKVYHYTELDTIMDGRLADIKSITGNRDSYHYALKKKNRLLKYFNEQHKEQADTVILYFHDPKMYSEDRIHASIDNLKKLHKPLRDNNGKIIKDQNGNYVWSEDFIDIIIKHIICVTKDSQWKEFNI